VRSAVGETTGALLAGGAKTTAGLAGIPAEPDLEGCAL